MVFDESRKHIGFIRDFWGIFCPGDYTLPIFLIKGKIFTELAWCLFVLYCLHVYSQYFEGGFGDWAG